MLRVVPVTIGQARRFVEMHHSHHHAPQSGLFAVGVAAGADLVCVAVLGRPSARALDATDTIAEVTRSASIGVPHAASKTIAAVSRMALAGGYRRLVSYTILGEHGTSYRAAGWRVTGAADRGGTWHTRDGRNVTQTGIKIRWEYGPDALPLDTDADRLCRESAGVVAVPPRREVLPLLIAQEGQ